MRRAATRRDLFSRSFVLPALAGLLLLTHMTNAQSTPPPAPPEWLTHAEKTDYRETPSYEATIEYARRLDAASPLIRYSEFGRSGEGRALPLLVAASGDTFTPPQARGTGKAVVLVQACIHAGEPDGKDAGLALLRDIAVTKTRPGLLEKAVVLFIPVYSVDGHARSSPYSRINQNGPAEMGWRGNATNLNLNRDYLKADAPETRAWLRLWNEWSPDLFIDCHVTNGADYRYNVTYQFERHENTAPSIRRWSEEAFEQRIVPATERAGNLLSPYMEFRDNRDPQKGIESFVASPRFATAYVPVVRNRPALLIETHMLKPYRPRVRGTYDLLAAALEEVNRDPGALLAANRQADEETASLGRGYDPARRFALSVELTGEPSPKLLKTYEFKTELSDVSGAVRVVWDRSKPLDLTVPFHTATRVARAVAPPLYYVVPPQWKEVIGVLSAHGLRLQRLASPLTLEVESYRFREVKFASSSFEGRVMASYKAEPLRERRSFLAGSVVVSLAQPGARAALHLLEPEAPDSLAAWGFFHPVFEMKEYAENYVLESLAREMLAKDEKLRREFEERIANDSKFASSARERLNFFYERSPYRDRFVNVYPVARVVTPLDAKLIDF